MSQLSNATKRDRHRRRVGFEVAWREWLCCVERAGAPTDSAASAEDLFRLAAKQACSAATIQRQIDEYLGRTGSNHHLRVGVIIKGEEELIKKTTSPQFEE